jgi:CRP-like cAMP-binding protein
MPLFPELENLGAAMDFIDGIYEVVEHIPLFGGFSYPDIERLSAYMECFGAPAGTALLEEGQDGDWLILLLTGSIEVVKKDEQGVARPIAIAGPGSTVGEMSLIDGRKRNASCITLEPTDFAVLTRSALNSMLAGHSDLCARLLLVLLTEMTSRLRAANERLMPHIGIAAV